MFVRLLAPIVVALALLPALSSASLAFAVSPAEPRAVMQVSQQEHDEDEEATTQEGEPEGSGGTDVSTVVIWTIAGIVAGGVVFTAFYMLKRRVGGFPENPDWVAPITIMYSKDNASEGAFGEASGHGDMHHAAH